ncbi:RDD family protein [Maritimibacter alexandrii]|nr:RDD family protein [Maritimibacter alexandrii]
MMNTATYTGLPDPDYQSEFYADVPAKRALAWVFDTLIVVGLVLLLILLTVGIGFFFAGFLWLVVGFVYRVVTLANGSATLGMRLMSIEIRRHDGQRLDLGTAVMHTLGYTLSMSFVLPQIASIILMMTGDRGQGLTDLVLGTAAINRSARM